MDSLLEGMRGILTWDVGLVVHLATLGYVLGFLFKNQLILRMLVLMATIAYMIYYYAFPAEPLWGAIFGSVLIMLANIIGTIRLLYDRLPIKLDPQYQDVFRQLRGIKPGEFRRLIKIAEHRTVDVDTVLTVEHEMPDYLFYLMQGTADARKGDTGFGIPSGKFVGEVSFILNGSASATVTVTAGCSYLRWNRNKLNRFLKKNPNLQQTFEALIGRDMAAKVAISEPIFLKAEGASAL